MSLNADSRSPLWMASLALATAWALAACSVTPPPGRATPAPEPVLVMPEGGSGWNAKTGLHTSRQMVAAAHPLAADAALAALRAGGSALDAAIAAQMVLSLVEPQSSGIGGGAFLMLSEPPPGAGLPALLEAWDGRETAPAGVKPKLFLDADGKPLPFVDRVYGGRAVATPGVVRMLAAAHRVHGKLPWPRLFDPAIRLSEQGVPMGERLYIQLKSDPHLRKDPLARAYFYGADGQPHPVGHVLRNPALAQVLRALAASGGQALYEGPIAQDLVRRVQQHAVPGSVSSADLAAYQPRQRQALCTLWQQRYRVCGFPPPSSGHLAVMQILGMLDRAPGAAPSQPPALQGGLPSPDWLHRYTEASRLAYADRALYVADPDFVPAPAGRWDSLLDDSYLRQRAALIGPQRSKEAPAGKPGGAPLAWAPMPAQPEYGTSHISVVDAQGRAVAMTTTIEAAFGARVMADGGTGLPGGYLLNNQMTDFSPLPADEKGQSIANRVEGGKRPRSSMSPTLVFDASSGELLISLGSPGGPAIIHFVAKTLLGTLAWGLDAQAAINLPNFGSIGGPLLLETAPWPEATLQALAAKSQKANLMELTSGLQAIQRLGSGQGQGWFGGADPRREGAVRGD